MNSTVFEYNGHHFQPYAKYTAPIKVFDEFINYDTVDFKGAEFNREDFYNKSPLKIVMCFTASKPTNSIFHSIKDFANMMSQLLLNTVKLK